MVEGEVLLTVAEAAAVLQVHPQTLREWERSGAIRARRTVGGHRRFARSEVEALRDRGVEATS